MEEEEVVEKEEKEEKVEKVDLWRRRLNSVRSPSSQHYEL